MTAKSNTTAKPNRALERLADVLIEDIVGTPADQLLAEVAEDYGNPRALATTFDKVVLRARTGNDRSVAGALPGRVPGSLARAKRPYLAGRAGAFWQGVIPDIPAIFDVIFPNRLAMLTISSACIASLAVIIAAPTVLDRIEAWHSGVPTAAEVLDGAPTGPRSGPSVREREADGERGSTRGLYPSAPLNSVLDFPSAAGDAGGRDASVIGPKPGNAVQGQSGAGAAPLQSSRSVPLAAGSPSTPVAPPAAAPRIASVSNPAPDSYVVQIALQRSKVDAQASVRQLKAKFPSELGSQEATVRRADLGPKGVYYRALVGPFGSADDADRFCSKLKAAGGQCTVQKD